MAATRASVVAAGAPALSPQAAVSAPHRAGSARTGGPVLAARVARPAAVPLLIGILAAALYVRLANPAVGGGNSGEFQVMAYLLGIAHPPSYPLYLLLAKGASLLPLPG